MSYLDELRNARPYSRFLRATCFALGTFVLYAWLAGDIEWGSFLTQRRWENLQRFIKNDIIPPTVSQAGFTFDSFLTWAGKLFMERGWDAALATLGIAILSILFAALLSGALAPLAASNLATQRPFSAHGANGTRDTRTWLAVRLTARGTMIVLRAIPEYVLAFLFLTILGPETAWPAILALALHNAGILGRLGAETIENLDPRPLRALHAIGIPRRSVLVAAIVPQSLGRYLLYFFYRLETCVREASVLGILGIVSLGYWIEDAREKLFYDEMIFFVVLGALIVIATDFVSAIARRYVRGG